MILTHGIILGLFVNSALGGYTLPMTDPENPIENVSDTSFWVAYFRAQETARPDALFNDPFAARLAGEHGKRIAESMPELSRYTAWSVVARTVIIDRFIENGVRSGDIDAVVNLGAGLDARPYRMNLPSTFPWVEVDYPNIIQYKTKILANEKPRVQLARIELDLAVAEKRRAFFASVLPSAKKILVLTEGVIPYLTESQTEELGKDLFTRAEFSAWVTEYFDPKVYPYLRRSARQKLMRKSPFVFYPQNWFGFFEKTGWVEKETRFTAEIAEESGRMPPMPKFLGWIFPFLPKKVREGAVRLMGYTMLKRKTS